MKDYIAWKQSHTSFKSVPHYERWVRRFHIFLGRDSVDFTLEDVGRFKIYLQTKYNPRNIQYGLSILRDYINYNIAVHGFQFPLHLFKVKNERSISHQPITKEQFKIISKTLNTNTPTGLQRKLMMALLFETGMRVGELTNLKIENLEFCRSIIENEKNKRSRLIAWSEETEELLQKYLLLRRNLDCVNKETWLFVSFHYHPTRQLTTRQVERIVKECCQKAGITDIICPHSFRHGFVHRKLDEGKPITTIAQMLGHSTAINVMNYARLTSREIKLAWNLPA